MLKTRIITALLILPATVAVVFLLPSWGFRLAIAALLLIGSWEYTRLAALPGPASIALVVLQAGILALLQWQWATIDAYTGVILITAAVAWLLMFTRLFRYQGEDPIDTNYRVAGFLGALASITFCWYALAWSRELDGGPFAVFLLLVIIWAADIGAYFAGRFFGKSPLAPQISPKKTREGVYGGLVLAAAAAFLWSWLANLDWPAAALLVGAIVTALASVGGDLFVSVHKRTVKLKDSGALFPGHGGVLDRYDSLLAGAPFFALAAYYLGR